MNHCKSATVCILIPRVRDIRMFQCNSLEGRSTKKDVTTWWSLRDLSPRSLTEPCFLSRLSLNILFPFVLTDDSGSAPSGNLRHSSSFSTWIIPPSACHSLLFVVSLQQFQQMLLLLPFHFFEFMTSLPISTSVSAVFLILVDI